MDSHLNIDEIAGECGFDDATYFRRVFKRLADMPPSAFRKLHSKIHVNSR